MSIARVNLSDVGNTSTGPAFVFRLTSRQHLALASLFLVALVLRGAYLWGQVRNNPMYGNLIMDSAMHDGWARQIADGDGMGNRPYFRAPLYYYLLAILYKTVGPEPMAGRIAGCLAGAFTCYLIGRLGALLAGFGPGLLAGLIAAFYWPFIYFDTELLTVGLEVLLDVGFLYLLLRAAQQDSPPLFLFGGVVWGLSAITRPNVLAFAPGVFVWLWIALRSDGRPPRRLRAVALVLVGLAIPILPVTVRNHLVGGEPVLIASNGGVNFYIGNNPKSDGTSAIVPGTRVTWQGGYIDTHRIPREELGRDLTEGEVSDYWYAKAFEWIRADPRAWLGLSLHKLRVFLSPVEMPNDQPIWFFARMSEVSALFWIGFPVVACLGIAGMTLLLPRWRTWSLLLAFLVIYTASVVAFFVCGRYRLPVVPVLILAAAAGAFRAVELARARRFELLRPYWIAAGVAALVLLLSTPKPAAFNARCEAMGLQNLAKHFASPPKGRPPDRAKAIEYYREVLRLSPQDHVCMSDLAWLLATAPEAELRDGAEALRLVDEAEALVRSGRPAADTLHVRAAALAELGRYDEAVQAAQEALEFATCSGERQTQREITAALRLYEQRSPYRLPR